MKWLTDHDKPFGVYHYCNGQDAAGEATHFYNTVKPVIGKAVPIADYEGDALRSGTAWLKKFLDKFRELSGVKPMIYCSLSVIHEQDFSALTDHPLWVAQYADMATVYGFVDKPWQKGSVAPFASYAMHQYTSCGRLNGWGGNLDFDKFYGSYALWLEMARGEADPVPKPTPKPTPLYKPVDPSIVLAVLKNEYGIGTERVVKLREAGYDPAAVQTKINQLYAVAGKVRNDIGDNMSYINSILWIARS